MRYAKYAIVAVIFASLVAIAPNFAYSQAGTLTVKVDKTSYATGETITISGTVPAVLEGVPVAIQVFNPRNTMYTIDQVTPNADGTYSTTIKVGGKLGIDGIYTVKATYSGQSVQATFEFKGVGVGPSGTIRVEFLGNVFNVKASLSNGSITKIEVDPEFTSLIITVKTSATEDGILDITLPRELIDARTGQGRTGDDDKFIVLVDGNESEAKETATTATERSLSIPVPAGTEEIEIIGTIVIPEFGILAAFVLAAAVGAIIVVSRKNQILKVLPI